MSDLKLPWVLGARSNDDFQTSETGGWQEIDVGGHAGAIRVVVRMQDADEDLPAGLAAVRLILAASDLLVVAKDFEEALGELHLFCECGQEDCRTTRLRAAIAKATGAA